MLAPATCPNCQFPLAPGARACPLWPARPRRRCSGQYGPCGNRRYLWPGEQPSAGGDDGCHHAGQHDRGQPGQARYTVIETPAGEMPAGAGDAPPLAGALDAPSLPSIALPVADLLGPPAEPISDPPPGSDLTATINPNGDTPSLPPGPLPVRPVRGGETAILPGFTLDSAARPVPSPLAASVPPPLMQTREYSPPSVWARPLTPPSVPPAAPVGMPTTLLPTRPPPRPPPRSLLQRSRRWLCRWPSRWWHPRRRPASRPRRPRPRQGSWCSCPRKR